MTGAKWWNFLLAIALVVATACKKEEAKAEEESAEAESKGDEEKELAGETPEDVANRPAEVAQRMLGASKLSATPLMAHIPADSPYVLASFEPIPKAYWQKVFTGMAPIMDKALAAAKLEASSTAGTEGRVARAILKRLEGKLSADGLAELGFSTSPNFAVYGIGPFPVFRFEIADGKKLARLVAEIEKEGGESIPKAKHAGVEYWRFADRDSVVVVAVLDDQITGAVAPPEAMKKMLPLVLGTEKPASSMADGAPLKDVIARHGFASYGVGYLDLEKVLAGFLGKTGGATAAAWKSVSDEVPELGAECQGALAAAVKAVPRLAFGYDEISARTTEFTAVLETAPAISKRLREVAVAVPGLSSDLSQKPLFMLGGGFRLGKGRALGRDAAGQLSRLGEICKLREWREAGREMLQSMSAPLPPMVEGVRGFVVSVTDGQLGASMPTNIQGYAVIAADKPKALLASLKSLAPSMPIDIKADGAFHKLQLPIGPPMVEAVYGAVKDEALVIAAGVAGKQQAEKAVQSAPPASPIFLLAYDYGTLMSGALAMGGQGDPGFAELAKAQGDLFGLAAFWAYVSPKGLGVRFRMDFADGA